ncbi:MAG: hypothetical protein KDB63_22795 [Nocardioidaceae bacterium]|nr:hypothetical protein [Nocardioidaceae bacterium]
MDVFFSYTREQAIADGVLVDVTEMAKEAGIRYPTAVTRAVWCEYVEVPEKAPWQDESGRLWDILWMMRHAIVSSPEHTDWLRFSLYVQNDESELKEVQLKSVCGPGDTPEPVITIMLPDED